MNNQFSTKTIIEVKNLLQNNLSISRVYSELYGSRDKTIDEYSKHYYPQIIIKRNQTKKEAKPIKNILELSINILIHFNNYMEASEKYREALRNYGDKALETLQNISELESGIILNSHINKVGPYEDREEIFRAQIVTEIALIDKKELFIGDIEIPIYGGKDLTSETEQEIVGGVSASARISSSSQRLDSGKIIGYLSEMGHSDGKSVEQQREDLLTLDERGPGYNSFRIDGLEGYLGIESIRVGDDDRCNLVKVVLDDVTYLKSGNYGLSYFLRSVLFDDGGFGFFGCTEVCLPVGCGDVRFINPETGDLVVMSSSGSYGSAAGEMEVFRFPYGSCGDLVGGVEIYLEDFLGMTANILRSQGEKANTKFKIGSKNGIPKGTYKAKIGLKDNNIEEDILVKVEDINNGLNLLQEQKTTNNTEYTIIETQEFEVSEENSGDEIEVSVEKNLSVSNEIKIDSIWLDPVYNAFLGFKLSDFVEKNTGKVKIYDDMNSDDPSDWVQVYDPNHRFSGDPGIGNSLVRFLLRDPVEVQVYTKGGWSSSETINFEPQSGSSVEVRDVVVRDYSPEKAIVELVLGSEDLSRWSLKLRRGEYQGRLVLKEEFSGDLWSISYGANDFALCLESNVGHRVSSKDHNNTFDVTLGDNYLTGIPKTKDHLDLITTNQKINATSKMKTHSIPKGTKIGIGALPTNHQHHQTIKTNLTTSETIEKLKYSNLTHGEYLTVILAKDENQVENDLLFRIKDSNNNSLSLNGSGLTRSITLTENYKEYIRPLRVPRETDPVIFELEKNSTNSNTIYISDFLLIPIHGDGVQDISRNLLRDYQVIRELSVK